MKAISIILIIAIIGLMNSTVPAVDAISTISPTTGKKTGEKVTITFTLKANSALAVNDIIIFSLGTAKADVVDADPRITVTTAPTETTHSGDFYFNAPGTYNVFVKNADDTVKQTGAAVNIVISGPAETLITKIAAETPKAGQTISFTFTTTASSFVNGNKITLSTTTPSITTDPTITLEKDEAGTSFTRDLKIDTKGDYFVYVTKGTEGTTKQKGVTIAVASSGFISLTFAALLGLLLF